VEYCSNTKKGALTQSIMSRASCKLEAGNMVRRLPLHTSDSLCSSQFLITALQFSWNSAFVICFSSACDGFGRSVMCGYFWLI
jgi:predicted permease